MTDKRYQTIKDRLCKLTKTELQRILDNIDKMCVDTFNYDEVNHTFCPLALAMNLHQTVENPTDRSIKNEISKRFIPVNIISGIEGNFYRKNRKSDLSQIINEILSNELYSC
jgi:hypothetical protein